jgi:hypothetical protein
MVAGKLHPAWTPWTDALAQHLHGRLAGRLAPLLLGFLFARGRRVIPAAAPALCPRPASFLGPLLTRFAPGAQAPVPSAAWPTRS